MFREPLFLLSARVFSLCTKGVCVIFLYGSGTWPVKEYDSNRLYRNYMRIVRWMYNVPERRGNPLRSYRT